MRTPISLLAAAVTLAAACTDPDAGGSGAAGDKVGNPPPPVMLTLVTAEQMDRPGGDMVERFVAAVGELSEGRVTIVPTFGHPPDQPPAWDQANLRALLDGEFDMAFIPARAWHSEGVTTLEPLQLPFVIETDEQADRVATDPVLTVALMAGLADIDVTGIGLYPEALRHLIRLDGTPISASSDLTGLSIRAPRSDATWQLLEALGATVDDPNGPEMDEAVATGRINAAESSLIISMALAGTGPPSVLVNIPLYTKFNVLAISDAALEHLDQAATAVLRDAAANAMAETVDARPRQAAALEEVCAAGLATVFATEADREAWRDTVAPVTERITSEGDVGSLLARVRDVAGPADREPLSACPDSNLEGSYESVPRPEPDDLRPTAGDLPDGTYRFAVDQEMILAAYPNFRRRLDEYSGVFTVELDGGRYTIEAVIDDDNASIEFGNVYEVEGDVITLAVPSGTDFFTPMSIRWRWTAEEDGSLSFEPFSARDRGEQADYTDLWTIPDWEPIG